MYSDVYISICLKHYYLMRTSILIKTNTRDELRRIGRKEQTYDDIVNELLKKAKESFSAATLNDLEREY